MTTGAGAGVAVEVLPVGDEGLLLEVASLDDVLVLDAALRVTVAAGGPAWRDVTDVVPAARTVLMLTREGTDLTALARAVRELAGAGAADGPGDPVRPPHGLAGVPGPDAAGRSQEVEIEVRYDGPDLDDVARLTGLSRAEVVAAHTGTPWRVAFGGFAPGFAYLVGGDPRLVVPRRDPPPAGRPRRVRRPRRRVLGRLPPRVPGRLAAAGHDGSRPLGRAP